MEYISIPLCSYFWRRGFLSLFQITNPYPIACSEKEDNHIVQRFEKYTKYNITMSYRVIYTFALFFIQSYLRASSFSIKLLWLHISKFSAPWFMLVLIFSMEKQMYITRQIIQYHFKTFSRKLDKVLYRIMLFILCSMVC